MQERWLVLYELLHRIRGEQHQIGRTKLQKLVYFLQELGADLGYRFEIHQYGPHSYDLASDVGVLENLEVVRADRDPGGYGYQISEGRRPADVPDALLRRSDTMLDRVVGSLAPLSVQQLEVMATIHFMAKALRRRSGEARRDEVIEIVRDLKPAYLSTFIEEQYTRVLDLPNQGARAC